MNVSEIMTRGLVTVQEGQSLAAATALLREHSIRHLPVVNRGGLVGLVTQRDILRVLGDSQRTPQDILVRDVMTRDVATVSPESSVREAIGVLLGNKYGCLPVVASGKLIGIITEADLVRFADQRIEELDRRDLAADYE